MLCNRLASEAKEYFEKDEIEEGGLAMFKVKLGQPRNKQLLRMMEDPEKRKAVDKPSSSFTRMRGRKNSSRSRRNCFHDRREIE